MTKEITKEKFLIRSVIKYMIMIGNHKNMSGDEKKKWVLQCMRDEFKIDEKIENLIYEMIDYMIMIDSNKIKINAKEIKRGCLDCINYFK